MRYPHIRQGPHQGVVRLIAARESGWEGAVDDIVPLEKAYTERPMNIDDSMTLL
jgi:hypothetical protein